MSLLRFFSVERLLRGLVIISIGLEGLRLSSARYKSLTEWSQVVGLVTRFNPKIADSILHSSFYDWLFRLQSGKIGSWIALFAAIFSYGILICVEAVGLWLDLLWAEKLAVISTSAFIPLEIWELAKGFSLLKFGAFVLNVFLVIWLYRTKWHSHRKRS